MKLKGSGSGQMVHIGFTQTGILESQTTRMELKIILSSREVGESGQMLERIVKYGSIAKKLSPDQGKKSNN